MGRREGDSANWGGTRKGAGRPRKLTQSVQRTVVLDIDHLPKIIKLQEKYGAKTISETFRKMIDELFFLL